MFSGKDSIESLKEGLQNMEQQLVALYEEKSANGGHHQSGDHQALHETIESLEAQLDSLYSEKENTPENESRGEAHEMVKNLEEQIIALVTEKMELESQIMHNQHQMHDMKDRAREMGAALVEAALFPSTKSHGVKAA